MIRPLSRTSLVLDIVGAFLLFAVLTLTSFIFYAPGANPTSGVGSLAESVVGACLLIAAVLQSGAVAVARLSPGIALAAAWVGAIVQMGAGLPPLPINLAILIVLFASAAWGGTRIFWAGLGSVFVGGVTAAIYTAFIYDMFVSTLTDTPASALATVVLIFILCVSTLGAPWLGGFGWRMVLRWRASRAAQAAAEVAAAEEQERVRIARDMHDVVAHSLAVIVAQSDGARYAAASDPQVAAEALSTISQTARSALSDVRMLLTQLRHRQGDGPQPTIADLEQLFAQVRHAGIEPRVTVDPVPPGEPPAAIQLAVYRILQEALTNAIRHGDGRVVDIRLSWRPDLVELEIRNSAALTVAGTIGGHGLVGMRERAQLVGGTLTTGREGGEFVVRGELPIAGIGA